jgi:hypothetical protein
MERNTPSVQRLSRWLRVLLTDLLIRDTEDSRGKAIGYDCYGSAGQVRGPLSVHETFHSGTSDGDLCATSGLFKLT